ERHERAEDGVGVPDEGPEAPLRPPREPLRRLSALEDDLLDVGLVEQRQNLLQSVHRRAVTYDAERLANALLPAYTAPAPSSKPMRSSWLYFATRSDRERLPVLIWPALVATARSAMNASSVSPERWLMIERYPAFVAMRMASKVSETVPIWFSLMRMALAVPVSMPRARRVVFVTKMSSPTSWRRVPRRLVCAFHPSQSSSEQPSSMETMGYL